MLSRDNLKFAEAVSRALANTECSVPLEVSNSEWERVFLIGNGGSAAIASHVATDVMKFRNMAAIVLTDPAISTCFANDYGYEYAYAEMLDRFGLYETDLLIAISSSGKSQNICVAAQRAVDAGAYVATFTGFYCDNPLRKIGHSNYWVPSHNYGVVECAHLMLLHSIVNPGGSIERMEEE